MPTGTISDFDTDGLFGLIAADDGRLMIFNVRGVTPPISDQFRVGARVDFVEQKGGATPRAAALVPVVAQ